MSVLLAPPPRWFECGGGSDECVGGGSHDLCWLITSWVPRLLLYIS